MNKALVRPQQYYAKIEAQYYTELGSLKMAHSEELYGENHLTLIETPKYRAKLKALQSKYRNRGLNI